MPRKPLHSPRWHGHTHTESPAMCRKPQARKVRACWDRSRREGKADHFHFLHISSHLKMRNAWFPLKNAAQYVGIGHNVMKVKVVRTIAIVAITACGGAVRAP